MVVSMYSYTWDDTDNRESPNCNAGAKGISLPAPLVIHTPKSSRTYPSPRLGLRSSDMQLISDSGHMYQRRQSAAPEVQLRDVAIPVRGTSRMLWSRRNPADPARRAPRLARQPMP
jgi:hypothetical protein